ncbi:mitochondrial processing peptidase [Coprinopsis cinerea okayama7|uniref:Mitochondrial processing peptidase n=1 Tax=Coprinopsis cinerea (strain Okayama-7 / 130 / ATCC MYA-4618 / FGSC 9003) TaxID=240176 RepID=A8N2Z7_COPC7|nr:mitochondrial processing peptidase [Coprinopsis cinerea okayama7\|eukprot:XP_001829232.1 mitochondrial processing peptidase [Coprinopsis cinerea okayama7\
MRKASCLLRPARAASRRRYSTHQPSSNVQITTLPNKLRVATDTTPGHFSSVGLYIDAGARYETPDTTGASYFLDRMAFKSTKNRSDEDMAAAISSLGSQIMASSSRETMMYQSSHFHKGTPLALELIADTIQNPAFAPEEILAQQDATAYEIREFTAKPELILPEILHNVAYGKGGLGNPLLCPEEHISAMNEVLLRDTMRKWYTPDRMVIAGAGMRHEELVELADKYFSGLKAPTQPSAPRTSSQPSQSVPPHLLSPSGSSIGKTLTRAASYLFPNPALPSIPSLSPKSPTSTYTGGHRFIHDPNAEFNHVYIAYEGVGIHDDDIYTLATLQVLLGGGGSFSAGGPGKGMYSRLYSHILNHYPQVDHCASFHHIYIDSSLFGLFASFVPAANGQQGGNTSSQILPHLINQLSLLVYTAVPKQELQRAKNQLKSSLMMALESRVVEVEDLGRQILVHGRKVPVTEMTAKIDQVDQDAVKRVATRLFGINSGNKPTVVCMGHDDVSNPAEVFRHYGLSA